MVGWHAQDVFAAEHEGRQGRGGVILLPAGQGGEGNLFARRGAGQVERLQPGLGGSATGEREQKKSGPEAGLAVQHEVSAAARGGETPATTRGFEVAFEGPEIGEFDHGLGAVGRVAAGIQGEVHLVGDEADDDGRLIVQQLGVFDAGGDDGFDVCAVALAGLFAGGDGAVERFVYMRGEQGLEGGAVARGEGGDDGAEGTLGLFEEFGRVEIGGALDDLHQALAERGLRVWYRAAGGDGLGLARDDRALRIEDGGLTLTLEPDALTQHAAQTQDEKNGGAREQDQDDRERA